MANSDEKSVAAREATQGPLSPERRAQLLARKEQIRQQREDTMQKHNIARIAAGDLTADTDPKAFMSALRYFGHEYTSGFAGNDAQLAIDRIQNPVASVAGSIGGATAQALTGLGIGKLIPAVGRAAAAFPGLTGALGGAVDEVGHTDPETAGEFLGSATRGAVKGFVAGRIAKYIGGGAPPTAGRNVAEEAAESAYRPATATVTYKEGAVAKMLGATDEEIATKLTTTAQQELGERAPDLINQLSVKDRAKVAKNLIIINKNSRMVDQTPDVFEKIADARIAMGEVLEKVQEKAAKAAAEAAPTDLTPITKVGGSGGRRGFSAAPTSWAGLAGAGIHALGQGKDKIIGGARAIAAQPFSAVNLYDSLLEARELPER